MICKDKLVEFLNSVCDDIIRNKEFLNELDNNTSDGDHGSNMSRGFKEVKEKINGIGDESISFILKTISMTLISSIGGASGLLYGSSFLKVAELLDGREFIDKNDIIRIGEVVIENIKNRGKIDIGCKSMLDTIVPAFKTIELCSEENYDSQKMFSEVEKSAYEGMNSTKTMKATYGRASFLGDESIGYIDAGAASSYIIIKSIIEELRLVENWELRIESWQRTIVNWRIKGGVSYGRNCCGIS